METKHKNITFLNQLNLTITIILFSLATTRLLAQNYTIVGDAQSLGNDCYQVCPDVGWKCGAVWYNQQIDISKAFDIELLMYFGVKDNLGADGIVFVLQQDSLSAVGSAGLGIGFQGFSLALGIEFDTYQNAWDPTFDHIAILTNGNVNHTNLATNLAGPIQAIAANPNIEDNVDHQVRISWNPNTDSLKVYFDCELRLTVKYDMLTNIFSGNSLVWWGFTSATGALANVHRVCLDSVLVSVLKETTICKGDTTQLNAYIGGTNYVWTPNYAINDTTISNPFVFPDKTTMYYISYTDKCGNQRIDSVKVSVNQPLVDLGNDTSICIGNSITLTPGIGYSSYSWQDGSINQTYIADTTGLYWVEVTDTLGCSGRDSVQITVNQSVVISLGNDTLICDGKSIILNPGSGYADYSWQDGNTNQTYTVFTAGTYYVQVTDTNGCLGRDTINVTVAPNPVINIKDKVICEEDSAVFDAGSGYVSYWWQDGSTNQTYIAFDSGTYHVDVIDTNGCLGSKDVLLDVIACDTMEIWIPNAFTPDANGINDVFNAVGINITTFEMYIYNRWGELIFKSNDIMHGWNGTYNGIPCKSDVYSWLVICEGIGKPKKAFCGMVALIL